MLACSVLTVAVLYLLDGNSVPMHRHQFMLRSKGLSVTTARPIVVARGAVMMN
jgi:predicted alpha/beta superfamily hydrolase